MITRQICAQINMEDGAKTNLGLPNIVLSNELNQFMNKILREMSLIQSDHIFRKNYKGQVVEGNGAEVLD